MSTAAYEQVELAFRELPTRELAASLSDERRSELRSFWLGRAHGELTTALSFEFVLEDLVTLGAPSALTTLARDAVAEEHTHADWCMRFARLLDDAPCEAELSGTRPLTFEGASAADNRLLRTVFGCCFSETVAVQVLLASQEQLTLDSARKLNRQQLRDEVRHARLGWGLLAWPELTTRDREMLAAFVPSMERLTRSTWTASQRPPDEALQRLGYLSLPLIEAAVDRAFDEVIRPGLEHGGVRLR